MLYFGFAIADGMFPQECQVFRRPISVDEVKKLVEDGEVTPCLNPSHRPTVAAMKNKFGLNVPVPEKPPVIKLRPGDSVIVMSVRGLPRLENRHEYTEEEISNASFEFGIWTVLS